MHILFYHISFTVNGTTGEGTSMSVTERKLVTEAWVNAIKRTKQHLMIQVGGAPLPDVIELVSINKIHKIYITDIYAE